MNRLFTINEILPNLKQKVNLLEAVEALYPDVKMFLSSEGNPTEFRDKSILKDFTHYDVTVQYSGLYISFWKEHQVGKLNIQVFSDPPQQRLAYTDYEKVETGVHKFEYKHILKFNKVKSNIKSHPLENEIRRKIKAMFLSYVSDKPNYKIIEKNLDPSLKDLFIFS